MDNTKDTFRDQNFEKGQSAMDRHEIREWISKKEGQASSMSESADD